jgi:glyoxylase-like metal-dependent hydrolase (beta-lactamase superfamily II)
MKINTICTGYFKLDGGAMFGVVPKKLWHTLNPPDDDNMCTWAMRALLIQVEGRIILVDTGIGTKQDNRFMSHFSPYDQHLFREELLKHGVTPEAVTDVLFTHLHFDHAGGAIILDEAGNPQPMFPNATYWTSERHLNAAMNPNAREKASYLQENFAPLLGWDQLRFAGDQDRFTWLPGIDLQLVYGHTEAMYILHLAHPSRPVIYCADLVPSSYHLSLPYVMAYDIRPLETLREKEQLYKEALAQDAVFVFEHDPHTEAGGLTRDDRGRIQLVDGGDLDSLL